MKGHCAARARVSGFEAACKARDHSMGLSYFSLSYDCRPFKSKGLLCASTRSSKSRLWQNALLESSKLKDDHEEAWNTRIVSGQ